MEINNRIVSTVIKKFTRPFTSDGCKSAAQPKTIYFKPSDVPMEELEGGNFTGIVTENAEVAPFADRLIHPNLYGVAPAVADIKNVVKNTEKFIEKIEDTQVRGVFSGIYQRVLNNMSDIPKESHRMTSLISCVEILDNPKIKEEILKNLESLNNLSPKGFKKSYHHTMRFAEDYANAANSLNGKYLCRDNDARKLYKWLDKKGIWLVDIIDGTKKSEDTYRKNMLSGKNRKKAYPDYLKAFDVYTAKGYAQTYYNNLRLDAMKKFFDIYCPTRPDAAKTLYHDAYLKTLSPEIAKECAQVQKEYNTYIINFNHDTTAEDIKYIKEELRLWKEAGGEEAVMPDIVYVNMQDDYLLKEQALGCADKYCNTVKVRELLKTDGEEGFEGCTVRHEIQHLHDENSQKPKNTFDEVRDAVVWKYRKIRYGKKWNRELEKAGLKSEEHRAYGFTDEAELRSVSAEVNGENLSEGYKTDMETKFKMQPWIFDIKENKMLKEYREAHKE